jgi:ParB/RepB/Spo0J family partition protein
MSKTRRRFSVDTLFADTTPRGVGVAELLEAKHIQLERIEPDPEQPRRAFDDERLDELAAAIRAEGVLQPIAVRYDEPRDIYVILHGERRWRAASRAGLASIPAIVREVPEDRRLLQQLMENIVREDLNAVDRAAALRALKARLGDASWDKVAEAVGIRPRSLRQSASAAVGSSNCSAPRSWIQACRMLFGAGSSAKSRRAPCTTCSRSSKPTLVDAFWPAHSIHANSTPPPTGYAAVAATRRPITRMPRKPALPTSSATRATARAPSQPHWRRSIRPTSPAPTREPPLLWSAS